MTFDMEVSEKNVNYRPTYPFQKDVSNMLSVFFNLFFMEAIPLRENNSTVFIFILPWSINGTEREEAEYRNIK